MTEILTAEQRQTITEACGRMAAVVDLLNEAYAGKWREVEAALNALLPRPLPPEPADGTPVLIRPADKSDRPDVAIRDDQYETPRAERWYCNGEAYTWAELCARGEVSVLGPVSDVDAADRILVAVDREACGLSKLAASLYVDEVISREQRDELYAISNRLLALVPGAARSEASR